MTTALPKHIEIQFYHVVGGIVVRFGFIDALIADIARTLFEKLGGHPKFECPPWRLSDRLKFISKCIGNRTDVGDLDNNWKGLAGEVRKIDQHRNFIVHGCLTEFFAESTSFQFTKIDPRKDRGGYVQISTTLSYDELSAIAQASTEVVRGLNMVAKRLLAASEKT